MIRVYKRWALPALGGALVLPLSTLAVEDATPNDPPARPSGQSVELNAQRERDRATEDRAADNQRLEQDQSRQPQRADYSQQHGKHVTLQGKLVWFEQYMMQRGEVTSSSAPNGMDMLALKTDQGLILLSHDAMRHLHQGSQAAGRIEQQRLEQQQGEVNAAAGIERRGQDEASAEASAEISSEISTRQQDQQQSQRTEVSSDLTLKSDDPNAQFRIVEGDEAELSAGDFELREGQSSRIERRHESNEAYGVERRGWSRSGMDAAGKQASVTGTMYEKDGIKFLKVSTIRMQDQASQPQTDSPRNP